MHQLSPHFSEAEFTHSPTASARGIANRMNTTERARARALCEHVLEPLRAIVGPLRVNSGFRSPATNRAVGGSKTSQHLRAEAADIETVKPAHAGGLSTRDLYDAVRRSGLPFDQLILEFPGSDPAAGWVHVSYGERHRRQCLIAERTHGRTVYRTAPPLVSQTPERATVRQGSRGPAVEALQRALRAAGDYGGKIDGDFGARTRIALVAWQARHGLLPDGIAGDATWRRIDQEGL